MIKNWNQFSSQPNTVRGGYIMIKTPIENWKDITLIIDPIDIYDDSENKYGIELNPHVTIIYGINEEECPIGDIKNKLKNHHPFKIKVNGIGIFHNDKFDVVKLNVEKTKELQMVFNDLNTLPNSNEFPDYSPHITIGYVKPGLGKKYERNFKMDLGYFKTIHVKYSDDSFYDIKI